MSGMFGLVLLPILLGAAGFFVLGFNWPSLGLVVFGLMIGRIVRNPAGSGSNIKPPAATHSSHVKQAHARAVRHELLRYEARYNRAHKKDYQSPFEKFFRRRYGDVDPIDSVVVDYRTGLDNGVNPNDPPWGPINGSSNPNDYFNGEAPWGSIGGSSNPNDYDPDDGPPWGKM